MGTRAACGTRLYTRASAPGQTSDPCTSKSWPWRRDHSRMELALRQIVAFGGGGFSMESGNPLLDDYVLGLSGERAAQGLLPALGQRRRRPLHRPLLPCLSRRSLRGQPHLALSSRAGARGPARASTVQDLIYVGGGSVISLLGVWRAHGIDRSCAKPGKRGVVLCGLSPAPSAGSPMRSPVSTAPRSGWRGWGCCRSATAFTRAELSSGLPTGVVRDGMRRVTPRRTAPACTSSVPSSSRVVASRPAARGYRLDAAGDRVIEMRLATTYLGDAPPVTRLPGATSSALSATSAA